MALTVSVREYPDILKRRSGRFAFLAVIDLMAAANRLSNGDAGREALRRIKLTTPRAIAWAAQNGPLGD